MKNTILIRKVDNLGRIVIPIDIRRSLKLDEGDSVEIYVNDEEEAVFKKYSYIGEIKKYAAQYAEIIWRMCHAPVLISDKEKIIAVAGTSQNKYLGRSISSQLEKLIKKRSIKIISAAESEHIQPVDDIESYIGISVPITVQSETIGCICLLIPENGLYLEECNVKLVQLAAAFLSSKIEEYCI